MTCSTIVVVTNNPVQQHFFTGILIMQHFHVECFSSAVSALDFLSLSSPPALIITSVNLNDTDGFHFVRMLRSDSFEMLKNIPVIMIGDIFNVNCFGFEADIDAALGYPVRKEIFISVVANLIFESQKKKHCLVIGQDENITSFCREIQNSGFFVSAVPTLQNAGELLHNNSYELVIMCDFKSDSNSKDFLQNVSAAFCVALGECKKPEIHIQFMNAGVSAFFEKTASWKKILKEYKILKWHTFLKSREQDFHNSRETEIAIITALRKKLYCSPIGMFTADISGNVLYINDEAVKIFGLKAGNGIIWDTMFSDEKIRNSFFSLLEKKGSVEGFEFSIMNGSAEKWLNISAQKRYDHESRILIDGFMVNVTGQRDNEKYENETCVRQRHETRIISEIAHSPHIMDGNVQKLYQEITELCGKALNTERTGIWLFNDTGELLCCRDLYEKSVDRHSAGYSLQKNEYSNEFQALEYARYIDANDPNTDPRVAGYVENYLKPNRITSMLDAVIRCSGRNLGVICFEHVNKKHLWVQDEISFACQIADQISIAITQQERNHELTLKNQLVSAIEQAAEMIVITDTEGIVEFVNPAFEKITGYSKDEIRGKSIGILRSNSFSDEDNKILWNTIRSGKTWHGRFSNLKKDGTEYIEESSISPVFNKEKVITHYVAVKRDITEYMQLSREKSQIEEQYYQAQKMEAVGQLAAGIAHDFNNLLTPIICYSEMLEKILIENPESIKIVKEVKKAGTLAQELVQQLLNMGRKQIRQSKKENLNMIVNDFYKLIRRTLRENIKITENLLEELPIIQADTGKVKQILMNLALNAQDAMPNGGMLTISTGKINSPEQAFFCDCGVNSVITLSVSDTGCGIESDVINNIFTPFFTTKGPGKGSGLGLSTVYSIMQEHGGMVKAYSRKGYGTTIICYFPAFEKNIEETEEFRIKTELKHNGGNILVVDDDSQIRDIAWYVLKAHGYTPFCFDSGETCLKFINTYDRRIDALILDVILPDVNGKELFKAIQNFYPGVNVLYMSGYSRETCQIQDEPFIAKPFDVKNFLMQTQNILQRH